MVHNGDDGCVFIFVECMERCGVGRGRTGEGKRVGACVRLYYLKVLDIGVSKIQAV